MSTGRRRRSSTRGGRSFASSGILKYPLNAGDANSEYPHTIQFSARRRNGSSDNPRASSSLGEVILYLPPDALKTSYSQTFGDTDLGSIGVATAGVSQAAAQGVVGNVENAFNAAATGGQAGAARAITNLTNSLSSLKSASGGLNIGQAIAQATVNEGIRNLSGAQGAARDALFKKAGRILNPHKAVIYQGPGGFRVFNYSFVMSPESQAEAETIAKIVQYFKYYMHPGIPQSGTVGTGGNINSSLTLSYPEEFKISARVKGGGQDAGVKGSPRGSMTVRPLFKIDHCFLESLSVDYSTSGGPAFIVDGITAPATTSLTLQFKETVLMTKEKIEQGF